MLSFHPYATEYQIFGERICHVTGIPNSDLRNQSNINDVFVAASSIESASNTQNPPKMTK